MTSSEVIQAQAEVNSLSLLPHMRDLNKTQKLIQNSFTPYDDPRFLDTLKSAHQGSTYLSILEHNMNTA